MLRWMNHTVCFHSLPAKKSVCNAPMLKGPLFFSWVSARSNEHFESGLLWLVRSANWILLTMFDGGHVVVVVVVLLSCWAKRRLSMVWSFHQRDGNRHTRFNRGITFDGGGRFMHRCQSASGWSCGVRERQIHLTRDFSHTPCTCVYTTSWLKVSQCAFHSIHMLSMMLCVWAFVVSSCLSLSCFSPASTFSLSQSTCSLSGTPSSMSSPPRVKTTALTQNEEYCSMAIYSPLTGYEPKLIDNFDYSETSAIIFQNDPGDIDTDPSYSCDAELDDETNGKAQSSPLFVQERGEPANQRQAFSFSWRKFVAKSVLVSLSCTNGETRAWT